MLNTMAAPNGIGIKCTAIAKPYKTDIEMKEFPNESESELLFFIWILSTASQL